MTGLRRRWSALDQVAIEFKKIMAHLLPRLLDVIREWFCVLRWFAFHRMGLWKREEEIASLRGR